MLQKEFNDIQRALLGDNPAQLGEKIKNGEYAAFFIKSDISADFSKINQTPRTMLVRWWALIMLTNSDIQEVCGAFSLKADFAADLQSVKSLYEMPCAENMQALKRKLASLTIWQRQNYIEIIAAFSALNTAFYPEQILYLQLLENNEAYLKEDLAVDKALLTANGIPKNKADYILTLVLNAVIKNPEIKTTAAQLSLAKQLNAIIP